MKTVPISTVELLSLILMLSSRLCNGFVCAAGKRSASATTIVTEKAKTTQFSTTDDNFSIIKDSVDGVAKYTICWTNEEGTQEFEAYDGELLRTAALRRGVVSPHNGRSKLINCRGLGTCGTCAVEIEESDAIEPREKNTKEKLRLSFPPHNPERQSPRLRLACQVQVRGDLHVTKRAGFWGQNEDLSPSSEYGTYFGGLEYLLDSRSPDQKTM